MPNRRTAVRLTLTSAACAAALALAPVPRQTSRACPPNPPTPLRLLYEKSDLVAVALAGDTARAGSDKAQGVADGDQKQDDAYEAGLVKTTLQVEKTLKGDGGERAVSLYHYQGGEEVDEEYAGGTRLLVFLSRRGAAGYAPTDYRYAIKKLPEDDLKVYLRRIGELSAIESRERPDPAEITEWLVRCAEEPATRWEGAYELALHADVPMYDDEEEGPDEAASPEEQGAGGAPADAGPAAEVAAFSKPQVEDVSPAGKAADEEQDFAQLLTPAQKERLARVIFDADKLGDDEMTLLPLVAAWDDQRVVPFLLGRLQETADNPPREDETIMMLAARALEDRALIKFAADYYADSTYEDREGGDGPSEPCADDGCRKEAEQRRVAGVEARTQRSSKVYQFVAMAQQRQPRKPAAEPR